VPLVGETIVHRILPAAVQANRSRFGENKTRRVSRRRASAYVSVIRDESGALANDSFFMKHPQRGIPDSVGCFQLRATKMESVPIIVHLSRNLAKILDLVAWRIRGRPLLFGAESRLAN